MKPMLIGFRDETDAGLSQPIADDFASLFHPERVGKDPRAGRQAEETEQHGPGEPGWLMTGNR